jgi:cell division protein FtsI/penicillin-binding protein 2
MNKKNIWRYNLVGGLMFIMPVLVVFQMVRIKVNPLQVEKLIKVGISFSGEYRFYTPARGRIYDRWGNLMVGNKTAYEVGIDIKKVENPSTIAKTLELVLGLDYADVFAAASLDATETAVYRVVMTNVEEEYINQLILLIEQMEDLYGSSREKDAPSLSGLTFKPHLQRIYPDNELGSNIIGFVNREGVGFYGVEEKYNDLLAGDESFIWIPLHPGRVQELPEIPEGASLVLTIDRAIQRVMERVIDDAIEETGADAGTLIVIDPKTGELLALATTKRLNANVYWKYQEVFTDETPFNPIVSQAYEPGSVFKIFTMVAALDSGAVTTETEFIDTGVFEIGGTRIFNWDKGAYGLQNMQGCMQHSLNVCLAWVAKELGPKDFYQYMLSFGFGHLTGIDLAGEVPGRLKIPGDGDWYDADLGTNSFGQGVSVTPLQMVVAASALANQGKMMAPHIVRSVINDGYQHDIEQRVIGMPIQAQTAKIMSEMLARSLEKESSDALVSGYRLAGKTGTAEIPTQYGYTTNETNASFIGWGPIDDPQFLVYVWLEKPKSSQWGSVVAAPVFRKAVEQLVVLMDIPPDDVRSKLAGK